MNPGGELPLYAAAIGMRAGLPLLLKTRPLDRVLALITLRPTPHVTRATRDPGELDRIERVTDRVTRDIRLTRSACLHRALIRYALMRRKGYDARFVIGVRAGGEDGFEAHAWVTLQDRPVMERQPTDYRPTFTWPPTA